MPKMKGLARKKKRAEAIGLYGSFRLSLKPTSILVTSIFGSSAFISDGNSAVGLDGLGSGFLQEDRRFI